jgi:hypothetical protein
MAANDREIDDAPMLGGRHPLAVRANDLDALTEGEREWITESVDRTDHSDRTQVVRTSRGDGLRFVGDADRLEGDVAALAEARSRSTAFEPVDGIDVSTAAHLCTLGIEGLEDLVAADSSRLAAELDVGITEVRSWQHEARSVDD